MKKLVMVLALALCGTAMMAATSLWDGDLAYVSLQSGKKLQDVSVKTEDGALLISGTTEGNSVTYISVEIRVKPFVIGDKYLTMEISGNVEDWTVENVFLSVVANDDASGIKSVEYSFDNKTFFSGSEVELAGNCKVYFKVTDNAGNVTTD